MTDSFLPTEVPAAATSEAITVTPRRHIVGRLSADPAPRLGELVERLQVLARSQRDEVVNTREIALTSDDGSLWYGGERYHLREHAFGQLAAKLQIPAHYLRRCDPDLRSRNVNRWLREHDRNVLLRLEGDEVRAVLSGSYRRINHLDILNWIASRLGEDTPVRFELAEGYLDLQVVGDPQRAMPDSNRDPLHKGLHLRNSEVGLARIEISALVYRTICLNGLVMGTGRWAFQRRHVGRSDLSEQVRAAFDRAIELSGAAVTAFAGTRGVLVPEPDKTLRRMIDRYELAEEEGEAIFRAFKVEPGDTLYNVINALTRAGNDAALAQDSRHTLQSLGGRITDLSVTGRWIDN